MHTAWTTAVSPTSQSENAYWPTWYETSRSENHDAFWSNCSAGESKSNLPTAVIQKPTSTSDTSAANDPAQNAGIGTSHTRRAPATGRKIRIVVRSEEHTSELQSHSD